MTFSKSDWTKLVWKMSVLLRDRSMSKLIRKVFIIHEWPSLLKSIYIRVYVCVCVVGSIYSRLQLIQYNFEQRYKYLYFNVLYEWICIMCIRRSYYPVHQWRWSIRRYILDLDIKKKIQYKKYIKRNFLLKFNKHKQH